MRTIDHLVGVPLCAIVSPLVALTDKIKNIFSRDLVQPKKILFIELSEMGSAILAERHERPVWTSVNVFSGIPETGKSPFP